VIARDARRVAKNQMILPSCDRCRPIKRARGPGRGASRGIDVNANVIIASRDPPEGGGKGGGERGTGGGKGTGKGRTTAGRTARTSAMKKAPSTLSSR
jgi:hypothetical protein